MIEINDYLNSKINETKWKIDNSDNGYQCVGSLYTELKAYTDIKENIRDKMSQFDELSKIAYHYGHERQIKQTIEELAELIQALSKMQRGTVNAYDNMTEEMADVEIMLDQLKLLFKNTEQIEVYKKMKIQRQMERMKNETQKLD